MNFILMLVLIVVLVFYAKDNPTISYSDYFFLRDYLQAHHTDIDYIYEDNNLIIEDVYCYNSQGSSMNPAFFQGNTLCFRNYTNDMELRQGNIIHYETNGVEITHRIVSVDKEKIVVKGDNVKRSEVINYSQVKGLLIATLYS